MTALFLERAETAPSSAAPAPVRLRPERPCDSEGVDALIARAFGPGRYAKTAERLREGAAFHPELSVCAWTGETLAGAVRLWPARIGSAPALFLGPIAVEAALRGRGLGAELVEEACRRACTLGEGVVILVGDLGFFGPLGFEPVAPGRVTLPGPVDPRRVLWTALRPGALEGLGGALTPAVPA
jgi:predicted N-acetyltransferase YhbS